MYQYQDWHMFYELFLTDTPHPLPTGLEGFILVGYCHITNLIYHWTGIFVNRLGRDLEDIFDDEPEPEQVLFRS